MILPLWIILASVFAGAAATGYLLISARGRLRILDHPNERSLHSQPMPRTGGLAIWLGMLAGFILIVFSFEQRSELYWTAGAALLVGFVSFIDDHSQVPIRLRLIVHLIASTLLLMNSATSPGLWPGDATEFPVAVIWLFALLFIVWMTNLYNFMDGMDGFAGGMSVIGFGTLGLLGYLAEDGYYASVCWVIAAAAAGFLVWNFPPARIFMGDVGSSTLGLLAAAMFLWADRAGLFPLWLSLLVFSPFIVDATITLVRRTLNGERVWEAHRSHYYQRVVQAGWSHRRTALWEYGLMLLCAAGALIAFYASVTMQWLIIAGLACIYAAAAFAVHRAEARRAAVSAS